jgi:hypothetical protein
MYNKYVLSLLTVYKTESTFRKELAVILKMSLLPTSYFSCLRRVST